MGVFLSLINVVLHCVSSSKLVTKEKKIVGGGLITRWLQVSGRFGRLAAVFLRLPSRCVR